MPPPCYLRLHPPRRALHPRRPDLPSPLMTETTKQTQTNKNQQQQLYTNTKPNLLVTEDPGDLKESMAGPGYHGRPCSPRHEGTGGGASHSALARVGPERGPQKHHEKIDEAAGSTQLLVGTPHQTTPTHTKPHQTPPNANQPHQTPTNHNKHHHNGNGKARGGSFHPSGVHVHRCDGSCWNLLRLQVIQPQRGCNP
jgi:hypothetical protein